MKKSKERENAALAFAQEHYGAGKLIKLGRFSYLYVGSTAGRLSSRPTTYAFAQYAGGLERYLLVRRLIQAHPEVISDLWLDNHKDKFEETEQEFILKKEFRHLPFFGVTPYRLLQRLGTEVKVLERESFAYLAIRTAATSEKEYRSAPHRGLEALI